MVQRNLAIYFLVQNPENHSNFHYW